MTNEERHKKAREYGEEMRAVCGMCAEGVPVVYVSGFGGSDAGEYTMHRKAPGHLSPCAAEPIHEQFLQLLQEPVSTQAASAEIRPHA